MTTRDPLPLGRTTLGEAEREVARRRERRCVRCGVLAPAADLFICGRCEADPDTMRERSMVEEAVVGYAEQRRALIARFGWRGGWWR